MKKLLTIVASLLMVLSQMQFVKAEDYTLGSDFANIVVFAHFKDDTQESADSYFNSKYSTFKKYFDGDYGQSLKSYMSTLSQKKFTVHNYFPQESNGKISSIQLTNTMAEGKTNMIDESIINQILTQLPELSNQTIDYNNDGKIDNLYVVLKAEGCSDIENHGVTLVAHSGTYQGDSKYQKKNIFDINVVSSDRLELSKSGLLIHEFLHTFNYPDLYTNTGATNPVYLYDIMGTVSMRPSLSLAYLRSTNCSQTATNWVTLPELSDTSSQTNNTQTIKLDSINVENGTQAYILRSPLSTTEFFVVEYRKATANRYSEDALDADIFNPGVIVYRIDTTIDGLSNKENENRPAIYVFRPQNGQNGYNSNERICMQGSTLSKESGRTSIGSSDLDKGLSDGALTFSDGSNSGIVISNVGSSSDNQIQLDVTIPKKEKFDLWKDMNYNDSFSDASKKISIKTIDNVLYSAAYNNNKLIFSKYDENTDTWTQYATTKSISGNYLDQLKLFSWNNILYLSYISNDGLKILKYENGQFIDYFTTSSLTNDYDITCYQDKIYYVGANDSKNAKLYCVEEGKEKEILTYSVGNQSYLGIPKILVYQNYLYFGIKNTNGNSIEMYKYENDRANKVDNGLLKANSYDIHVINNKLYVSLEGNDDLSNKYLRIATYSNDSWNISDESSIESSGVQMFDVNNHVYVISSPTSLVGKMEAYLYEDGKFTKEGESIDSYGSGLSVEKSNQTVFLSYVKSNGYTYKMYVKKKNINVNNIKKKNLNTAVITKSNDFNSDNGNVTVKIGDITLQEGKDYNKVVTKSDDGTIYVSLSAISGTEFEGSVTKAYKDISKLSISCQDVTYTGNAITNKVKIRNGSIDLVEETDYKLSYSNNTNIGQATVTITGIGDYYGSIDKKFNICKDIGENLKGYSLSLDGSIGFNFFFDFTDELLKDTGAYVIFELPENRTYKVKLKDSRKTSNGYRISCYLAAKEMTQKVNLKVVTSDNRNGKTYSYSVDDYAHELYKYESNENKKSQIMAVKSMMNYGGYSQKYFNTYTDNLAYNDVKNVFDDEMSEISKNDFENYAYRKTGSEEGIEFTSMNLQLESSTGMKLYFTIDNGKNVSDFTFKVNNVETQVKHYKNNIYYVEISNVDSNKLDEYFEISIGKLTVSACILSYGNLCFSNSSTKETLKETMKSLYLYYKYSKAHFG